jgi:hypothetical protein
MEKFMFLFRGSDVYQPGRPVEDVLALKQKLLQWVVELTKKGLHVASEPLEPSGKQVSGTKKSVTDAAFGLSREVIGGCTIIEARDLSEAVEIAKGCPILESNANIEVRPIQKIDI